MLHCQSLSRGLTRPLLSPSSMCAVRRNFGSRARRLPAGSLAAFTVTVSLLLGWQQYYVLRKDNIRNETRRADTAIWLDAALPSSHPINDVKRKVARYDQEGRELVPTGNSCVPVFPRTLELPDFADALSVSEKPDTSLHGNSSVTSPDPIVPPTVTSETQYTLIGLGMRSVSFLGINVYLLGFYVADADMAELQSHLVGIINPMASTSTLNPTEKDLLRAKLLSPVDGEQIWDGLLRTGVPARSVIRVVPVRDTDFHHLRDGFVRAIQARVGENTDDEFGKAMRDFKKLLKKGKVPKRRELLISRDKDGRLALVYDEEHSGGRQALGTVGDERISRALWMNYLAGQRVASEEARRNIVKGIMELFG